MTGRPCKPDSDLKGLWRTLLGTPFPACGIAEESEFQGNPAELARSEDQGAKQDARPAASPRG
jgi:hypothetical protein